MNSGHCESESAERLKDLCRQGRLYEVEAWVREGKSVNVSPSDRRTPLVIAVEKGFHSLVELLLRNEASQLPSGKELEIAVRRGDAGIAGLLIDHGADPHRVRTEEVCRCGDLDVVRLFLDRGVDLTRDNGFAVGLIETKKALLGIYRSYRDKIPALQTQMDIALRHCAGEGLVGGVYRLMWAGANPRAKVLDLHHPDDDPSMYGTAFEAAALGGHFEILKRLGVDPSRDDLNGLLNLAAFSPNAEMIRYLVGKGADINSRAGEDLCFLAKLFRAVHWREQSALHSGLLAGSEPLKAIYAALELGAKWERGDGRATHWVRSGFHSLGAYSLRPLLEQFRKYGACSDAELIRLLDTPPIIRLLQNDLKPFIKLFPGWKHAQKRQAEIEEKRRSGRWR